MSTITTAAAGLTASKTRINVAASNIVNADSKDYQARDVKQTADAKGAVAVQVIPRQGKTDIDIDQELLNIKLAEQDFSANATVLKAERKRQGSLIDIFA